MPEMTAELVYPALELLGDDCAGGVLLAATGVIERTLEATIGVGDEKAGAEVDFVDQLLLGVALNAEDVAEPCAGDI